MTCAVARNFTARGSLAGRFWNSLPSRRVVLPANHVRINLLRRADWAVPHARGHRRQGYAAGQQLRAVRVLEGVQARALRQLQPAEEQTQRPREPISPIWEFPIQQHDFPDAVSEGCAESR